MENKFDKNIVLIGMPGCGKSTLGKILSTKLTNFSFIDIDEEIEKKQNLEISEIFKTRGEDFFRKIEEKIIQKVSDNKSQIISVGGGAFDNNNNQKNLRKNGIIIFLNCSLENIYNRIKNQKQRPLLNTDNPQITLKKLFDKRINNFLSADFEINANNNHDKIIEDILRILKNEKY